jgi:hypothetical protein
LNNLENIQSDNLKDELQSLSDHLFANTDTRQVRYFHLKSINNFIHHFGEIHSRDDQIWVYNSLKSYFGEATKNGEDLDRNMSSKLFDRHLQKIADFYDGNLGFSFVLHPSYTTTIYFIIFLLLFFSFGYWTSLIAIVVYAFQMFRVAKKYRTRKVYSLFY